MLNQNPNRRTSDGAVNVLAERIDDLFREAAKL